MDEIDTAAARKCGRPDYGYDASRDGSLEDAARGEREILLSVRKKHKTEYCNNHPLNRRKN